jgi:D-glycero-D-manno-heptose 1,7-bisphosphate phosphatase
MLYLFDMDGTLIEGHLDRVPDGKGGEVFVETRPYGDVIVLPERRERLDALRAEGHMVHIVTQQGGVAFGHQTYAEAMDKLRAVMKALGHEPEHEGDWWVTCCFAHPEATVERFRAGGERRKPSPSMLLEVMQDYGYSTGETVFVGDLDTDRQAAEAAGVRYFDAEEFFAQVPA